MKKNEWQSIIEDIDEVNIIKDSIEDRDIDIDKDNKNKDTEYTWDKI